jgi:hypothetical protein
LGWGWSSWAVHELLSAARRENSELRRTCTNCPG